MNGRVFRSLLVVGVLVLALLVVGQVLGTTGVAHAQDVPIFVSTDRPGMTEDGVSYGREDVLAFYSDTWYVSIDGSELGLSPSRHNINALAVPWFYRSRQASDFELPMALMTFSAPRTSVPDIPVRVYPQDVVMLENFDRADGGASFYLMIDGSDIGLNNASEGIDGISWYPTEEISDTVFFDYPCMEGFFAISTKGPYVVPTAANGIKEQKTWLKGSGSDILLFCPTELGYTTRGYWFKLFDSFAGGITPRQAIDSISVLDIETDLSRADADLSYGVFWAQTARRHYTAPSSMGPGIAADPSQLALGVIDYISGTQMTAYMGIEDFNGQYPRLNGKVDALEIPWYIVR